MYDHLGLTCCWVDDSDDFAVAGRVVFELSGRDRAIEFVVLPWTEKIQSRSKQSKPLKYIFYINKAVLGQVPIASFFEVSFNSR